MALSAAVLPDQLARPPLRHPEHLLGGARRRGAGEPGSPVSPPQLLQRLDLELLVGHDPLQAGVLALQFLQPLDVVGLQPAVLGAPAVVGRLADLQLLGDLGDLVALGQQPVASRSLRMISSGVWRRRFMESSCPSGRSDSHTSWTNLRESRQAPDDLRGSVGDLLAPRLARQRVGTQEPPVSSR
jgi:hypothetical protein